MDTTNYKIQKCGGRRCLTCSYSEDNNSFFSNLTGKRFYPKTGDGHFLNCKSDNIIYLISCKICNLQSDLYILLSFRVADNFPENVYGPVDMIYLTLYCFCDC